MLRVIVAHNFLGKKYIYTYINIKILKMDSKFFYQGDILLTIKSYITYYEFKFDSS